MTEQLTFELLSPVKKLIARPVTMVTVPGTEGDFGVLPGHAPMVADVRPGLVEMYDGERVSERIFISGGFAEVTGEKCVVLTQEAIPLAELSAAGLEAEIKELGESIAELGEDSETARAALAEKLVIAQAKLEVAATAR